MKEIELLKIIFKDSPDILEPLNGIDKEIERLQKENNKLKFKPKTRFRDVIDLRDENKRLHSIIKEVRELIVKLKEDTNSYYDECFVDNFIKDSLEILDKES